MLPNIISNITLAVIAIFVLYTIFPIIQDSFLKLLGIKTHKKNSKDDFDEMIERKKDILSKNTSTKEGLPSSKNENTRDEFDYLKENHFFASEDEYQYFIELKKELSWGSGDKVSEFNTFIKSQASINVEMPLIVNYLKKKLIRTELLQLFPEKGLSKKKFLEVVSTYIICENIKQLDLQVLSKKLQLSKNSLIANISITVLQKQKQDYTSALEDFIMSKEIEIVLVKNIELSELIADLKKNIDIIFPLEIPNSQKLEKLEIDDEMKSKRLKKYLTLYHPDKWSFISKTEIIDRRLRENFDIIQGIYSKGK